MYHTLKFNTFMDLDKFLTKFQLNCNFDGTLTHEKDKYFGYKMSGKYKGWIVQIKRLKK